MADILERQKQQQEQPQQATQPQQADVSKLESKRQEGQAAEVAAQQQEASTVELSTGERVPRKAYKQLSEKKQKQLSRVGIEQFNKINKRERRDFEASNTELATGEWIPNDIFEQLKDEDKQLISKVGVDEFNKEKQADLKANYIELATGEYVAKNDYDKLNHDEQKTLYEQGVDKYNEDAKVRSEKYGEAIKEVNAYLQRAAGLEARGYASGQYSDAHLIKLYDAKGNIVNEYFIDRGSALRSGVAPTVPVSIGTWPTVYAPIDNPYGLDSGQYKTITPEDYNKLDDNQKKQYVARTMDKVVFMLADDYNKLITLNQALPEGYSVQPTTITYRPDGVNIQHVKVTTPDGNVFSTNLSKAITQFTSEGILKKPEYVYPESVKSMDELAGQFDKDWGWINPNTGRKSNPEDVGYNDLIQSPYKRVWFNYNGKDYNMPEIEAQEFLMMANKVKNPDSNYELTSSNRNAAVFTDKATGKQFTDINEAYNWVMTNGKYQPYVQDTPYTGPQEQFFAYSDNFGMHYLVNTGTGGYRQARADEIQKAQEWAAKQAMENYRRTPPTMPAAVTKQDNPSLQIAAGGGIIAPKWDFEEIHKDDSGKEFVKLKNNTFVDRAAFEALPELAAKQAYNQGMESIYVKSLYQHDGIYDSKLKQDYEQLPENLQQEFMISGNQGLQQAAIAANTAFTLNNIQLNSGEWISKADYESLPAPMQAEVMKGGIEAINTKDMAPEQVFQKYKDWGLVKPTDQFAGIDNKGNVLIKGEGKGVQPVEIARDLGIGLIPVVGTIKFWDGNDWWWNAASVAGDVLFFIPAVKGVSAGVRAGQTLGKALGKVALAELKAPFTVLTRPKATAKAMAQPVIDFADPKKIDIASSEIRDFVLSFDPNALGVGGKQAKKAGDIATKMAETGQTPKLEFNGKEMELTKAAMQFKGEPIAVHTTYDVTPFLEGTTIRSMGEGGLYLAPNIHSRYFPGSATGKGFVPNVEAGLTEWTNRHIKNISKFRPNEIAAVDLPAVRGVDFSEAKNIPKDIAPALEDLARKYDATVYGSYSEWLRREKAAIPNDLDLVIRDADVDKFKQEALSLIREKGYKANLSPTGISISTKDGAKTIADIHPQSHFDEWRAKATSGKPPELVKIDGIKTIPLGEQYLLQAFGAIEGGAKASTRAKKVLKMSKDIEELIKQSGLTKKMPGAVIFRDEAIQSAIKSSGKLYKGRVEIESLLEEGIESPKPSQILEMTDASGETARLLVVGKSFTKAELAKMKLMGMVDTIRDLWRPAMKIGDAPINELDDISRQIRTLEGKIGASADDVDTLNNLRREKEILLQRAESLARNIEAGTAGERAILRPALVTFGDYFDKVNIRELARSNPNELARYVSTLERTERPSVYNELTTAEATRVQREVEKIDRAAPAREDAERAEIPRAKVTRTETVTPSRITPIRATSDQERVTPRATTDRAVRQVEGQESRLITPRDSYTPTPVTTTGIDNVLPRKPKDVIPVPDMDLGKGRETTAQLAYSKLTQKQKDSQIAWKQGIMYKVLFEPYGKKDIINSPYPIPGVEYHSGIGAAYRSLVALRGDIPQKIRRDMGIMDIEISRGIDPRKPVMKFTEDSAQKTTIRAGHYNGKGKARVTRQTGRKSIREKGVNFDTLISL